MVESLDVFNSIINHEWLDKTPWILFLNKKDLFDKKLATKDMAKTFPDYIGGKSETNAVRYIQCLYQKCLKKQYTQSLYVHITCALDTQQIKFVFDSVTEWIFKQRVIKSGLV